MKRWMTDEAMGKLAGPAWFEEFELDRDHTPADNPAACKRATQWLQDHGRNVKILDMRETPAEEFEWLLES